MRWNLMKKESGGVSSSRPEGTEARGEGSEDSKDNEGLLAVQCPPHTTERKLVLKIDLYVLPALCVLYLLAFLDRINIGNANVLGMSKELKLQGLEYNIALAVFMIPYGFFEVPSNVLLKKYSPRRWLSANMFMFGLLTIIQGFVQNFGGLVTTRFFLGLFEAPMFTGCFYVLSMWYKRVESQRRFTFFFATVTLAGAFGGLLAAAIGKMDGIQGRSGWRWVFILEGLLTAVIGIIFFFILPNFPEDTKWLKQDEKAYIIARLREDQDDVMSARHRDLTLKDVGGVFKDYKIWIGGFMYFGYIVPCYSYAYFSPSIINQFGYSPIRTQLFSVPPWACAWVFSIIIATLSDATKHRWAFSVVPGLIGIAGLGTLLGIHNQRHVQYGMLFLVVMGIYSAMPIAICWFAMNLGGHHRRAVGGAWQIGFGNLGGIVASFAFLAKDAPRYTSGYSICIAFAVVSVLACMSYGISCQIANKMKDGRSRLALSELEKSKLGDLGPDYRYML